MGGHPCGANLSWRRALFFSGGTARGGDDFGTAEARSLIPAASAVDPQTAEMICGLGALVTRKDMKSARSTPLSVVLVALGAARYADPDRDVARAEHIRSPGLGGDVTPTDFPEPVGGKAGAGPVSLLRDAYLKDVKCERAGDRANGEVSFARKPEPLRTLNDRFPDDFDGFWDCHDHLGSNSVVRRRAEPGAPGEVPFTTRCVRTRGNRPARGHPSKISSPRPACGEMSLLMLVSVGSPVTRRRNGHGGLAAITRCLHSM